MSQSTLPPTPHLVELAHLHGVGTEYWNWHGDLVQVPTGPIRAVLAALGVEAYGDEAVERSLAEAAEAPWRRTLPPFMVLREGSGGDVFGHVPAGTGIGLRLELEDGGSRDLDQVDRLVADRVVDGVTVGEATFAIPGDLPLGWHRVVAVLEAAPVTPGTDVMTLVVAPSRLALPPVLEERRAVGVAAQLYQVRSAGSWGLGDLADLGELGEWAAREHGADFVLVNPLHAAEPVAPMEASPYLPTTRRFVNPIYLRVEDVPGAGGLTGAAAARFAELAEAGRALNRSDTLDRDAVWALKREALRLVHDAGRSEQHQRELEAFVEREGSGLTRFATWCAIADTHGADITTWPEELADPTSPAVSDFGIRHTADVAFHEWLQWVLEAQLAAAQSRLTGAGMGLGVVHDLAVGVHPTGAEAWWLGSVLASGVSVGAPPDQFNQLGQDWSQPPWRPDRLAELGYAPFRDMVRAVLRDSGGIRVDHILGLFRLWWIPEGAGAAEGTYVYYDEEALLGILVLEAQRAGAVVVGEDLGIVPSNLREAMDQRGLLGTSILWFEWEGDRPRPPEHYRSLCLASVTTHDLPPTAGYLTLEHLRIRERLGLLTRSIEEERASEEHSIGRVRNVLAERVLLAPDADLDEVIVALHRYLGETPSRMLAVALPDLVGDRRAINQPGTSDEYPNWRWSLSGPGGIPAGLDEVRESPLAGRLFDALRGV